MKYSKPSLSIQDQLALLKARDLIVPDNQRAKRYLTFIGYYRLSVYFLPFQNNKDKFNNGTKFDEILNLYILDRKLKLLVCNYSAKKNDIGCIFSLTRVFVKNSFFQTVSQSPYM